ncbi:MAG: hypothetical protein GY696_27085 [Gammaproteobacteria bacterium]|nr:hypothetical protein [Gammaproteobacteria bacterium]
MCTVTCGDGIIQRYRGIDNPAVEDGKPCEGPNMQSEKCTADCVGKCYVILVGKIEYSALNFAVPTIPPAIESVLTDAGVDVRFCSVPAQK